jgi:hypothetical protein
LTHKAAPVAGNGSNLGKSIISKYKRVIYDLKNKKIFAYLEKFFVPLSLTTTRNNPTSPQNGPIKIFFTKSLYLSITNNEIAQNSKSKPKKFSFLCTFKDSSMFQKAKKYPF